MSTKKNEVRDNNITELLFTLRIVSTLALFEFMFFMFFTISFLFDAASTKLASIFANNMNSIYDFISKYLIISLLVYLGCISLNYVIVKRNNKYTKKIIISKIVLLIIIMLVQFIMFINL